jgi:hypothetical protein
VQQLIRGEDGVRVNHLDVVDVGATLLHRSTTGRLAGHHPGLLQDLQHAG